MERFAMSSLPSRPLCGFWERAVNTDLFLLCPRQWNICEGIWLCSIPARAITRMNTYFIPNGEGFVRQCQMTMCGSCCGCMLTAHGALVLLYRPICTHTTSATVERCIFTSTAWSLHWFRNGWGMQTWRLL